MQWTQILSKETLLLGGTLVSRALNERSKGEILYPPQDKIFHALELTPPGSVKVVIVGQDPYHGESQANGLSFSVDANCAIPPSLRNIFDELVEDIGVARPANGDLTSWAKKGVLLLNTTLTVYEHKPNSCASWGWSAFTQDILRSITALPQPVVFILWGAFAQNLLPKLISDKVEYPDRTIHIALEPNVKKAFILSSHPSPLSANKSCRGTPAFKGSKPFSIANNLLKQMGAEPIDWSVS